MSTVRSNLAGIDERHLAYSVSGQRTSLVAAGRAASSLQRHGCDGGGRLGDLYEASSCTPVLAFSTCPFFIFPALGEVSA